MKHSVISVEKFINAIHNYFIDIQKPTKTIDYYFLSPEEIFNFLNIENSSENMNNFIEAVSLLIKRSIKSERGIKTFINIKSYTKYHKLANIHPDCTSKDYQLDYLNDMNMHLPEFPVGSKFIYGDGSYTINLSEPVKTPAYLNDMDRELERDAEFVVVEEPYFDHYNYSYMPEGKVVSILVATIKSLKTGNIYRAYAGSPMSHSIVSSTFLDKEGDDFDWIDYDDYDDYDYCPYNENDYE